MKNKDYTLLDLIYVLGPGISFSPFLLITFLELFSNSTKLYKVLESLIPYTIIFAGAGVIVTSIIILFKKRIKIINYFGIGDTWFVKRDRPFLYYFVGIILLFHGLLLILTTRVR